MRLKPKITVRKTGLAAGGLKGKLLSLLPGPDSVRVGIFDGKLAQIAIYQEFGTRGSGKPFKTPRGGGFGGPIPERPFLRNAMRANRDKYQKAMALAAREIIKDALLGRSVANAKRNALRRLGVMAESDVVGEIDSMMSPPNSPLTRKLKGSAKPLIDTGGMKRAVTHKIEE